jgi:hypothetical protein
MPTDDPTASTGRKKGSLDGLVLHGAEGAAWSVLPENDKQPLPVLALPRHPPAACPDPPPNLRTPIVADSPAAAQGSSAAKRNRAAPDVVYRPGNIPLVLSVPHGGSEARPPPPATASLVPPAAYSPTHPTAQWGVNLFEF